MVHTTPCSSETNDAHYQWKKGGHSQTAGTGKKEKAYLRRGHRSWTHRLQQQITSSLFSHTSFLEQAVENSCLFQQYYLPYYLWIWCCLQLSLGITKVSVHLHSPTKHVHNVQHVFISKIDEDCFRASFISIPFYHCFWWMSMFSCNG